jgi:RNase P subunit RPR2
MEYRRKKNSIKWHYCKNCPNWPTEDYEVRITRPNKNDIDVLCLKKESEFLCKKQKK